MPPSNQTESAGRAHGSRSPSGRKISLRPIVATVLGGLLVVFALSNSQAVTLHWIVSSSQTPLIVVIAACGLIGFAVGWMLAWRRAGRRNAR